MNQSHPPSTPVQEAVELIGLVSGGFGGFAYWLGTQSVPWISDALSYSACMLADALPVLQNYKLPQLPLIGVAACIALLVFLALLPTAGPIADLFSRSAIDQQTVRLERRQAGSGRRKRFKVR